MKRIPIIFLSFVLCSTQLSGQRLMLQFESGLGSYSLKGLDAYKQDIQSNAPIKLNSVSEFASGWYYRPSLMLKYEIVNFGGIYTYQSASSHISGKNDTSAYRFDLSAVSHCPGLYGELSIYYVGNWTLMADASLGFIYSNLSNAEYYKSVDSIFTDKNLQFKGLSYFIEPGLQVKYSWKHFDLGLNAGYFITISPDAFYADNVYKDPLVNLYRNTEIKPEWNGFRLGVSLSYFIYRKTLIKPAKVYRRKK